MRLPRSQATFQTAYVEFQVSLAPAVPADHSGGNLDVSAGAHMRAYARTLVRRFDACSGTRLDGMVDGFILRNTMASGP